jgi:hypothetical protein
VIQALFSGVALGVIEAIFQERFPNFMESANRRAKWGSEGNGRACAFVVFSCSLFVSGCC